MPRQPRLDAPGLLQHVMARGIEGREIFKDDKDRESFLDRLATVLEETQTQCYAWALIPNHFHLLLRTGQTSLSKVMRRLMTGYAVTFNKRHKRSGHLFQNRYKSVVCEEDPYLLELIRYIHLNPLRIKMVQDIKELDKYSWTGHSVILGHRKNPLISNHAMSYQPSAMSSSDKALKPLAEATIEDVLLHFGDTIKVARRRYRQFVKNGIDQGKRLELQGGGLVRSAGGNKVGLLGRKKEERDKGDERVLGSGDFVMNVIKEANELLDERAEFNLTLDELVSRVCSRFGIMFDELVSKNRRRRLSQARAAVSYLAVDKLGYTGEDVARLLKVSGRSVSNCRERGKILLDNKETIREYLL